MLLQEQIVLLNKVNLTVKVHPNSSQEKIKKINHDIYEVWLKTKSKNNKANLRLIKILKKYFGKDIIIKSGFKSRRKIIEILN